MPTSEPMQIDTSPPSEVRAIRDMCCLKKYEAVGFDTLFSFLFKFGDGVLTPELINLLGPV